MEFGGGQLVLASDRGRKCSLLAVHPTAEKRGPSWLQLLRATEVSQGFCSGPTSLPEPMRRHGVWGCEVVHLRSREPVRGGGFTDRARTLEWTIMHPGKEGFCGTGLVRGAGWGES